MGTPIIRSGKFAAGDNLTCGDNVVIDVAEEVVVGDRCVLPDNAYFGGRRVEIGHDFYGYSWEWKRLDVGRGRRDDEFATLTVGDRCTFHDNKIDLARSVTVGNDVGLSPEVAVYTHYYWLSLFEGYPQNHSPVWFGDRILIGYRSVVLPSTSVYSDVIVGAQSVVKGDLTEGVWGGNPAKRLRDVVPLTRKHKIAEAESMIKTYVRTVAYRCRKPEAVPQYKLDFPWLHIYFVRLHLETGEVFGTENELSDDLRWFLFTRGVRCYTKRPFRKLWMKSAPPT